MANRGALVSLATFAAVTQAHTFKSCDVPQFEWAAYGNRVTGRMYGMTAAVNDNHIFAAGYLKSTLDPEAVGFVDIPNDYAITGPYTTADYDGSNAQTVTVDLKSYPVGGGASENAGGSWRAYEAGVVKIDKATGEPVDVYVYYGEGMDETTGLAALGDVLAISGHFAGNLSAKLTDGSVATILNSNTALGELPDPNDQFHAAGGGSQHTGVDDGFVIKASAMTGQAEWIVHYPKTNRDAQVVGVDVDVNGNVFGSGYACSLATNAAQKVCHGFVAKFAAADGTLEWEKKFDDLGAAFWIKLDAADDALYFTATTTYGGRSNEDGKLHPHCNHASCAVTGRLSATDGTVHWLRTFQGSPRWSAFDQSGDIELAADGDGPYVYVAFDDAGENGAVSLDAGTPYAGCKAADGTVTPEYEISTSKLVTAADCPAGSTFVARTDVAAIPAANAKTYTLCGNKEAGMACVIKYHKFTGLPVWSRDFPLVAAMVPSPDGKSLMIAGWNYASWGEVKFDETVLPGYVRSGSLPGQAWVIYNAKLTTSTGTGAYVLHSGGGLSERIYDMVGDAEGNVYNVGYMKNTIMNWGGPSGLRTQIGEGSFNGPAETLSTPAQTPEDIVTHLFVAKLNAATETVPSCLTTCTDTTDTATVEATSCFIDGVCYAAGDTAVAFGKACHMCDPSTSQTKWSAAPTLGTSHCFIDGICWADGDFLFTQRRTRSPKVYSSCKMCSPASDATAWSVDAGFEVVDDECVSIAPSSPPHAGTFTDDEGKTHTWAAAVPTIVTGTFQALTLMDMGLPASQVKGTFGERGTDGSNINGVFATSDSWVTRGNHGDHANAEHERETHFLSDPTNAEKALLSQMIDVSPECSSSNTWCNTFNATILDSQGWPDIIVAGPMFDSIVNADVREKAAQRGVPIIILSDKNTAKTEWKTFIDLAKRFEDLAKALGADVEAHTANDKLELCAKAAEFTEISHQASRRGVRALAGYMPFGPADPSTGNIAAMLNAPDRNPALMMLEELGMSIIHLDSGASSYYEFMYPAWGGPTMPANGNIMSSGKSGSPVPYNADFFLYEPRGALDFTSDSFAAAWPHPAVVNRQYAYYPITTLHYSYRHAADILDVVGAKLRTAAKLDPAETNCTKVEVIDSEHHRTTGLAPGQYACWNPVSYAMCQRANWQEKAALAGWTPPGPAFKKKTCNLDDHHGPAVGAADVQGGFYVEGINGVINSERDLTSGKRADDGTWAVGIGYNHGQMVLCTGMFCSADDRVTPKPLYVTAHTCAAIRFEYAPNSSSTVYELPTQQALDACDFSDAILRGDEAAGSPHFDVLIDYDHEKTVYFYASRVGCTDGQKVAVNVVEDYESNFAQCEGMGAGSSRIRHCDCNHQLKPSTLIDPCHAAFVYGCLRDMPDDKSCCPDETVTYDTETRAYVNATGGSRNTGTCISKSKVASNLENVPILKDLQTSDPARLSGFDNGPCVRYSWSPGYDPMCSFYKSISMCDVASKPHECQFDPAWLAWETWAPPDNSAPAAPAPMSFVDDVGMTHTWTKAQPKIVVGTFDAIALMHMGMDPSQIVGTFGERGTSGSNVNGYYHDGNNADHGDHASSPYDASKFRMDPTVEERAFLAQMLDLSPDCSATNFWCADFDQTILDANGWPDLIIEGAAHGPHFNSEELEAAASTRGIPIIRLTRSYDTEDAPNKGLIEIVHRFEELARALGVSDVSAATANDKAALCAEIEAFKPVAFDSQLRGVRALAAYLPYGPNASNGDIGGFVHAPEEDPVLVMLEELGMAIMHSDAPRGEWDSGGYVPWMSATHLMSTGARTSGRVKVPYPVDFWLYDSRVTLDFTSDAFAAAWPHPAVVAGQYASWASGGRLYSYRHAASILADVREKLTVAEKLNPMETTCTTVHFGEEYREAGLGPGEYVCYNPVSYAICQLSPPPSPPPPATTSILTSPPPPRPPPPSPPTPVPVSILKRPPPPSSPPPATTSIPSPVVITITASGSVGDYADTSSLRAKFAATAGVDAALVTIAVKAASVLITATIAVPTSTTSTAVQTSLAATLGTAASASAALGIPVESDPTITVADSAIAASDDKDSGINGGTVAGIAIGCLFAGLLIGGGAVCLRFKWKPIIKRHKSFEVDVAERRKEEEKL